MHVFFDGRIVESGGPELADELEAEGYARFGVNEPRAVIMTSRRRGGPQGLPDPAPEVHGDPLVYLDSANSAQKPQVVIDAEADSTPTTTPTSRAAVHTLGSEATHAYEGARDKVAPSSTPRSRDEIIFTRNITEALNLLAYSFSNATAPGAERFRLGPGDEIVVTEMEHHSNIVPWQLLAQRTGATFRWIPADRRRPPGRVGHRRGDQRAHQDRLVRLPVERARHDQPGAAHRRPRASAVGASSIVDAAQAAPHLPLDVQDSAPTSSAFTGHKLLRPDAASGCSGAATTCSTRCRRSSAAAR